VDAISSRRCIARTLFIGGESSGDDVAQMLSMHRRRLNRRLKAQGTTFHKELDRTRFKVARELLIGTHISLDDIAAALGYPASATSCAHSGAFMK
jgi:transcriptional regulator GlxA family with amidase domain